MFITEKIRIYPNKSQRVLIDQILYECKEFYNYLLECHDDYYRTFGKSNSRFDYDTYFKVYTGPSKHMCSRVRQNVEQRVHVAYKMFFNKNIHNGRPKFKSIREYRSFTLPEPVHSYTILKKHIKCTGLGKVKAKFTRPIIGKLKTCTIKKYKSGKYYACIMHEVDDSIKFIPPESFRKCCVGIDLGLKTFAQLSNGIYIKIPNFRNVRMVKRMKSAQRKLSRKVLHSKNWEKVRLAYSKMWEKLTNQRRDFFFRVCRYLVMNYDVICCEDLNIKNMFPNKNQKNQRRALKSVAFFEFLEILEHMCNKYSCQLIKVDPHNTTQDCCVCGNTIPKNLGIRVHSCPTCGLVCDRDLNASLNILHRALGGCSTVGTTEAIKLVEFIPANN